MAINPASTPSSLALSHSFLPLVFIKLFLNFVYLFSLFDEVLPSPLSLCPFCCLFFSTMNLRDPEDRPSFMGIPLNLRTGTESCFYQSAIMV